MLLPFSCIISLFIPSYFFPHSDETNQPQDPALTQDPACAGVNIIDLKKKDNEASVQYYRSDNHFNLRVIYFGCLVDSLDIWNCVYSKLRQGLNYTEGLGVLVCSVTRLPNSELIENLKLPHWPALSLYCTNLPLTKILFEAYMYHLLAHCRSINFLFSRKQTVR